MCARFIDVLTSQRPCVQVQEPLQLRSIDHACKCKRCQHRVASNVRANARDVNIPQHRTCVQLQDTLPSRSIDLVCKYKRRQHRAESTMCASARDANIAATMCQSARDAAIAQHRPCVPILGMLTSQSRRDHV